MFVFAEGKASSKNILVKFRRGDQAGRLTVND